MKKHDGASPRGDRTAQRRPSANSNSAAAITPELECALEPDQPECSMKYKWATSAAH
jgi:hypothetical protein